MAEMMIVIAIIGTVAAMTIPTLRLNIEQNKTVAAVKKAYNTLENANAMLLATNDARSIKTICDNRSVSTRPNTPGEYYLQCLVHSSVLKASFTDIGSDYKMYYYDGSSVFRFNKTNNETRQWQTKDGFIFITSTRITGDVGYYWYKKHGDWTAFNRYGKHTTDVFVDINGTKKPNRIGRDVFLFHINEKGEVIPAGGNAELQWHGKIYTDDTRKEAWQTSCNGTVVVNSNHPGWDCTGSIIDNGRIIYKFK